jgi:membrane-anchored glycerophosphoryl diester phosphodiesterase (GDPDase)
MEMSYTSNRIRALNLRDLLDELFRIFRNKFTTIMSASLLVDVPVLVLQLIISIITSVAASQMILDPSDSSSNFLAGAMGASLISNLLSLVRNFFTQPLLQATVVHISMHDLLDRPIELKPALKLGLGNVLQIALSVLLIAVATFILMVPLVCAIVFFGMSTIMSSPIGSDNASNIAGLFGIILIVSGLIIIAALFIFVPFILYIPIICIERLNVIDAFSRSWKLVKGSYWRVLGSLIVIFILGALVIYMPTILIIVAGYMLLGDASTWIQPISLFAVAIGQFFFIPITVIAYTLMYVDLRVRKEGFDMEINLQTPSAS